jgi:hypothetical protein
MRPVCRSLRRPVNPVRRGLVRIEIGFPGRANLEVSEQLREAFHLHHAASLTLRTTAKHRFDSRSDRQRLSC